MSEPWYTREEKELLEEFGGEWEQGMGVDGEVNGRPAEVRVAREDDRFRIGKDVHRELVEEDGVYLFDKIGDGRPAKQVSAEAVQEMTENEPWLEDRDYPHRFVEVEEVFPPIL